MLHRPTEDDRLRAIKAKIALANGATPEPLAPAENCSDREQFPEGRPVPLSRQLVDAAIEKSARLTADARQQARLNQARGSMKTFLAHARTIQRLPSFGRRMRE